MPSVIEKMSDYNRLRKYRLFYRLFKPTVDSRILDVGASDDEYQKNANMLEKAYPYPDKITVLGIGKFSSFSTRYPEVRVVVYDGKQFPFKDKQFDVCWSNAVLEHVLHGEGRELFIREIMRVAKKAFIFTPNRFFIIEPHTRIFFLHWLPKIIFDRLLIRLGKGWAAGAYMRLLSYKDIVSLLEKSGISNYKILKNRALFFTVGYIIILQ